MTFKRNLAELKRLKSSAPDPNKVRIQDLIDLYEAKRIPNYRTAYNAAVSLASRNKITIKSDKPLRLYHDIIDKYKIYVRTGNHEKVKTYIKFEFPDPRGEFEKRNLQQMFHMLGNRPYTQLEKVLMRKPTMKIQLAVSIKLEYQSHGFDNEIVKEIKDAPISTKPTSITKSNYKKVLGELLEYLVSKFDNLDWNDMRSGFKVKKFNFLGINIFETKPARGSSYIPTPERYTTPKCSLISLRNTAQERFSWCMLHHQTIKAKSDARLTVFNKAVDKYDYTDINHPTSYDEIADFEERNQVCIYVYTLTEENKPIQDKAGNAKYILNECIYLLRIEHAEQSHYVYIKNIGSFLKLAPPQGRPR